jgi:AmmeMemoRadiSam system protein B/AmmeMemoRadiSam system protein A
MMTSFRPPIRFLIPSLALLAAAASLPTRAAEPASLKVREPAVAGLFYPQDRTELTRLLDACLAAARAEAPPGEIKALVCPHAGYVYSGPVAASAYRLLAGRSYETVIVLASSHYAAVDGASVSSADVYRTPLGDVRISAKARALAKLRPFVPEARAFVQRPDWSRQSSRAAPPVETAHTWEHSDEVQVPFLQRTLKSFELVPVVCGEVDPARAATALAPLLDERTLLIISSDLSHYHSYADARELDQRCVRAVCDLDVAAMERQEACGKTPILTVLHLARQRGWQARLLDYRNSGDTAGDKSRVVGYAAVAFYAPPAPAAAYSTEERRLLLDLARRTVREVTSSGRLPAATPEGVAAKLAEKKGCFVTLTKRGQLRGCIGHIIAQEPLFQAIIHNARSAALEDPRFPPVAAAETAQLEIEISVLTEPLPLFFTSPDDLLRKLQPGRDGVVLRLGNRSATYLPQVWEQIPDKATFLNSLAEKAGADAEAWRRPSTLVFTYQVESFRETDH